MAVTVNGMISKAPAQESPCYDRIFPFLSIAPDGSNLFYTHVEFSDHYGGTDCGRAKPVRKKIPLQNINSLSDISVKRVSPRKALHIEQTDQTQHHYAYRVSQDKLESRLRNNRLTSSKYFSSPFGSTAIRKKFHQHNYYIKKDALGQGRVEVEQFEIRKGRVYDNTPINLLKLTTTQNSSLKKRLHYLFAPKLSSNGCWLIGGGSFNRNGYNPEINAKIYSLHPSKQFAEAAISEKLRESCERPITWSQISDKNKQFDPDLLIGADNLRRENGKEEGIDFDIYHNDVNELESIWQIGFSTDSDAEKLRSGDIIHSSLIYTKSGVKVLSKSNLTKACKTGETSQYKGFESSPKFSSNGKLIYFLAEKIMGDESSSRDLYVGSIADLKKGNCAGLANLTKEVDYPVTQFQVAENGTELSFKIIYNGRTRILFFALEETQDTARTIYKYKHEISDFGFVFDYKTFVFEGRGLENKVVYVTASHTNFPTSIYKCNWNQDSIDCGSKYKPLVTSSLGETIINEVGIERSVNQCLGFPQIKTDSNGNSVSEDLNSEQPVVRCLEFPQVTTRSLMTSEKQTSLSKRIHRFVLLPKSYDRDTCKAHTTGDIDNPRACPPIVLSIHGGPADAWTGVFSIREYRLAELGYIVVLPNPIGSIGFGQDYTDAVLRNWGRKTVNKPGNKYHRYLGGRSQLQRVICESTANLDYCDSVEEWHPNLFLSSGPVYALGFSYGGYMVNRMQAKGVELPAFVSVNGVFDLPWFADTTDQLWFPKFHLNCANGRDDGYLHCSNKFTCDKRTPVGEVPIIDQSPHCDLNSFNNNPSQFLAVFSKKDERVPQSNTRKQLLKKLSPEKIERAKQRIFQLGGHELGDGRNLELALDLFCWFQSLGTMPSNIPMDQKLKDECSRRLEINITDINLTTITKVQPPLPEDLHIKENKYHHGIKIIDQPATDQHYTDGSSGSFNILTNSF